MAKHESTQQDSIQEPSGTSSGREAVPGLILIFCMGKPYCAALPLPKSGIELGRGELPAPLPADPKMSRRHASVHFDGSRFRIVDHGSHNGTFVDGVRVSKELSSPSARLVRTGDSLFVLSTDILPYKQGVVASDKLLLGPAMQAIMAQTQRAAQHGDILHITGESGSGKEGVARAFHSASRHRNGPFVAINCATIAAGLAERLLFGARRGAFSGAVADAEGLIQSAHSGTLFLDEIADLDPMVQAKFLRVIETRQVLSLGSLRPQSVDLQICSASHRSLRAELVGGRFREDLYFRISRPQIDVPPLRQRLEEMPWLVDRAVTSIDANLVVHSSFVESCLLRHWPGNVREFLAEVRTSAQQALGEGRAKLEPQHLSPIGGQAIERPTEQPAACALAWHPPIPQTVRAAPRPGPEREKVAAAMEQCGGNISAAARVLGLHRTQLKRLLQKHGLISSREAGSLDLEDEE